MPPWRAGSVAGGSTGRGRRRVRPANAGRYRLGGPVCLYRSYPARSSGDRLCSRKSCFSAGIIPERRTTILGNCRSSSTASPGSGLMCCIARLVYKRLPSQSRCSRPATRPTLSAEVPQLSGPIWLSRQKLARKCPGKTRRKDRRDNLPGGFPLRGCRNRGKPRQHRVEQPTSAGAPFAGRQPRERNGSGKLPPCAAGSHVREAAG